MVTLLDCIRRVPQRLEIILNQRDETFKGLWDTYGERLKKADDIVLVGSGTSSTAGLTAQYLVESAAGLRVNVYPPSVFLQSLTVRNPNALYVFISQTGTSILTNEALTFTKEQGFMNAVVSEAANTPASLKADAFIDMGCGEEEYLMRTIGYSTTVLTLVLLGMEMGKRNGFLSAPQYDVFLSEARAAAENIGPVIDKTMVWLDKNRRSMLRSQGIFLSGSGSLYGVALEGAVKIWETPQIIAAGYELEEGIHGPNFGYNHNHCVIVLNDGGKDSHKAAALGRYMKFEKNNGFIVGMETADSQDLAFEPQGGRLCCLEFAAVVQTLAYRLAVDQGRDLFVKSDHSVMNGYFKSHN